MLTFGFHHFSLFNFSCSFLRYISSSQKFASRNFLTQRFMVFLIVDSLLILEFIQRLRRWSSKMELWYHLNFMIIRGLLVPTC